MRRVLTVLVGLALVSPISAAAAPITIASGTLTIGGGLVGGPGGWTSATLTYGVTYDDATLSYLYTYSFGSLDPAKAISHVITEVSGNFTQADMLGGTTSGGTLDTYSGASGGSNPAMPAPITGIKWNTSGNPLTFSWTIETLRAPMWGNTYAIDGKKPGAEVYAYNSGFNLVGAGTAPSCYLGLFYDFATCAGFLIVPDTVTPPPPPQPPVPEPASLILLGSGLAGLAVQVRRRVRKR